MKNYAEVLIDFYSKYEASVNISFSYSGKPHLGHEVVVFCAFVLKQMTNLKGTGFDHSIAKSLCDVKNTSMDVFNLFNSFEYLDAVNKVMFLYTYRGQGEKGFDAFLNIMGSPSSPIFSMKLKPRGFGILGKEVNFYAIQSINFLLKYFAMKYVNDPNSKNTFSDASNLCGYEYLKGSIGIGISQRQAIDRIMNELFDLPSV